MDVGSAPQNLYESPVERRRQSEGVVIVAAVMVLLAVIPIVVHPQFSGQFGFRSAVAVGLLGHMVMLGPVILVLWRNRETSASIGISMRHFWRESVAGLLLWLPVFISINTVAQFLQEVLHVLPSHGQATGLSPVPRSAWDATLGVLLVAVVACTEECVFRGYLLTRLEALTRSFPVAVVLSSVLFSIGHAYQGATGMVAIGIFGAVCSVLFRWRGNLTAAIALHFVHDLVLIVVLPCILR